MKVAFGTSVQAVASIWKVWEILLHAWAPGEAVPVETAQIMGIAIVDGLRALSLLGGPQALEPFNRAKRSLQAFLARHASPQCLTMLISVGPGQVRCLPFDPEILS